MKKKNSTAAALKIGIGATSIKEANASDNYKIFKPATFSQWTT